LYKIGCPAPSQSALFYSDGSVRNPERIGFKMYGCKNTHWKLFALIPLNYHFENPAIAAMKSDIVTFIHVKSINATSGFNLRIMKKIRQVALSYRKIKNKYKKADISTIDTPPETPGVSKDVPGST
jgi:hypothetical protein